MNRKGDGGSFESIQGAQVVPDEGDMRVTQTDSKTGGCVGGKEFCLLLCSDRRRGGNDSTAKKRRIHSNLEVSVFVCRVHAYDWGKGG